MNRVSTAITTYPRGEDVKRWISLLLVACLLPVMPVYADPIKWVDFQVPFESLEYAMNREA